MEAEDNLEYKVHPLVNDLVLQILFKQIEIRDIPKCRLVCRKWNQFLIPQMRSKVRVKCLGQTGFGKLAIRLGKFIKIMEASHEIPFGNYSIFNLSMNEPLVERFFIVCGKFIHTLRVQFMPHEIDICSLRELLLLRAPFMVCFSLEGQGIPEKVTTHPSLFPRWPGYYSEMQPEPVLSCLETVEFKTEEGQNCHPGFLCDLFKATVNLKKLTFVKFTDHNYSMDIMSALYQSGNYRNLKTIHLEKFCEHALCALIEMSRAGMKLREFCFQSLAEDVQSQSLEELIWLHRDTLEVLSLNEVMGTKDLLIRLPVMKMLRKLTRSAICTSQITFGPLCYATYLKSLEELKVYAFADELDWNDYFSETVNWLPCVTLNKLELPINIKDPSLIKRLARIFPSVTDLIITSPSDEIIPLLWQLWPELTGLHLSLTDGNSNVDTLFTGIPSQECNNINSSKAYTEVDIERIRIGPSIAFLRGLKKLHIDISPKDLFSSFSLQTTTCLHTDISGYFGFSYLSNLEELVITSSLITMECALFLLSKFQSFTSIKICDVENRAIISSVHTTTIHHG